MGIKRTYTDKTKEPSIYANVMGDIVEREKSDVHHLASAILLQLVSDALMTDDQTSTSYLKQCKASAINYFMSDSEQCRESRHYWLSIGMGLPDPEQKVEKIREVIKRGNNDVLKRRRKRNKETGELE